MLTTSVGVFNGTTWENLFQLVLKRKYRDEGYQHIPTSPGDCGLEGFTSITGLGFQCYCPEKTYTRKELYVKQRDKINEDLKKLKKFENNLQGFLGDTKIKTWIFVTPELANNDLIGYVRTKEAEVKGWQLSIIDNDFKIMLHDADYYKLEIEEIQSSKGEVLDFCTSPPTWEELTGPEEIYERNIKRKSEARLALKLTLPSYEKLVDSLCESTRQSFLEADMAIRQIENTSPVLHYKLIKLINEFEIQVKEDVITFEGSAEALTKQVTEKLTSRIMKDLHPAFNETTASQVSRYVVSRWLAVCQLDYD